MRRQARLGDDREDPLVALIGDRARPGSEQEHRKELQRDRDAQIRGSPGEAVHEQRHRRELQPRSNVGDEQPAEECALDDEFHSAEKGFGNAGTIALDAVAARVGCRPDIDHDCRPKKYENA